MLINLSELLMNQGKEKDYTVNFERSDVLLGDDYLKVDECTSVLLHIQNIGERTLLLKGNVNLVLQLPCGRCLESVTQSFSLDFERVLDFKMTDAERLEALDEQPYLNGYELDADQLVYNELLPNLPMKVLCSDHCKGICNRCGTNLNRENCDCDNQSLDPRMSVIQDIFKQSKEV